MFVQSRKPHVTCALAYIHACTLLLLSAHVPRQHHAQQCMQLSTAAHCTPHSLPHVEHVYVYCGTLMAIRGWCRSCGDESDLSLVPPYAMYCVFHACVCTCICICMRLHAMHVRILDGLFVFTHVSLCTSADSSMRCVAFARHALVFVLPVRGRGDRLQADMRGDCMADWISVLCAFLERSC